MTQAMTFTDLHEALGAELLTAEKCALAIDHVSRESNPLQDPALDAILTLAVSQLKNAIRKAFEIEACMRKSPN